MTVGMCCSADGDARTAGRHGWYSNDTRVRMHAYLNVNKESCLSVVFDGVGGIYANMYTTLPHWKKNRS